MNAVESRWRHEKSTVYARSGMVAAGHRLAARAGVRMLAEGGNAIDAAVAAGFAVGVAEPWMNGIGGSGAMVIHHQGTQVAIEFGVNAPQLATPDMYSFDAGVPPLGQWGWPPIKDRENELGCRSVGVPGLVAGLCLAHRLLGKLPLPIVMESAIELAEDGFEVDWHSALLIGFHLEQLIRFPDTCRTFLRDGKYVPLPGFVASPAERIVQKDLAATLRVIARLGHEGFYRGEIAGMISESVIGGGGLITRDDLASYEPKLYQGGLRGTYRDVEVIGVPGATGSPILQQILNVIEGFDIAALGSASPTTLHILAEACRRAYEDHFAHATDPDFGASPLDGLTSKEYAQALSREIQLDKATQGPAAVDPSAFTRSTSRAGHTTHVCAVDGERNGVTITQTHGMLFGSTVTVPGTGILLNDMMAVFDPRPGHTQSIAGGKRQAAPYTPAVLLKGGRLFGVVGAPGGRRIPTAIAQVVSNLVDHKMGIQDAIAAPRLHSESKLVEVDDRFDHETLNQLRAIGHEVIEESKTVASFNFANPLGIVVDPDGDLAGGTDPCMPSAAVGLM